MKEMVCLALCCFIYRNDLYCRFLVVFQKQQIQHCEAVGVDSVAECTPLKLDNLSYEWFWKEYTVISYQL